MAVLLLFNKDLNWTVERIENETQIKSEVLNQVVCSLLKSKILVCEDISDDKLVDLNETDIEKNFIIILADNFQR